MSDFIGDRVAAYGTWQGPAATKGDRFRDDPACPPDPRWQRGSVRMRRLDHDLSQWIPQDAGNLSRAQAHGPGAWSSSSDAPIVWAEVWFRLNSVARWDQDDFHMMWEVHTPSANPGGIVALNLKTVSGGVELAFRQWVGPGQWDHAYRGRRLIRLGEWHQAVIGYRPSTGNRGYYKAKFDGQVIHEQRDYRSTTQDGTHYEEIGFYTYWDASGTDDMNIITRVTTTEPMFPGQQPTPTPTPDPTPEPTPDPDPKPDPEPVPDDLRHQLHEGLRMIRGNASTMTKPRVSASDRVRRSAAIVKECDGLMDALD